MRKYEVSVVVEIDDHDGTLDEEFMVNALAIDEAAALLTRRSEGFEDENVVIHVLEVP